jgi:hypothetical protein
MGIRRAADEAVLKNVHKKRKNPKNPLFLIQKNLGPFEAQNENV